VVNFKALALVTSRTAPFVMAQKGKPLIAGEGARATMFPCSPQVTDGRRPHPILYSGAILYVPPKRDDLVPHPVRFSAPCLFEPAAAQSFIFTSIFPHVGQAFVSIAKMIDLVTSLDARLIAAVTLAVTQSVFSPVS